VRLEIGGIIAACSLNYLEAVSLFLAIKTGFFKDSVPK
jgi:hypothetical protein